MPKSVVVATLIPGHFIVNDKLWMVTERYVLHAHIGAGSYGEVCKATDLRMNQTVAIKKIPDILCNPLLAKRVLREVFIMRRLTHPYIITHQVEDGVDLYIVTEFADRGDMYHFKGPLSPNDVKSLMWQLLLGIHYMHSCRVWHRDIKSENTLLTDKMRVKLCDFGLARSAEEPVNYEPRPVPVDDITPSKKVLTRQYTKMVVTPNYRAPEVIMSKGQYSSAIDIWSLGCVFWELLIRSATKHTNGCCRPLFGVRGEPVTPEKGENYAKDGLSPLAEQLDVIFNVIGTPCWKDIESVPSESWRGYLKRMPGRAGNLEKNLVGIIDEEAIDLVSRMLAFDPSRRCTADEALAHAYFKNLKRPIDTRQLISEDPATALSTAALWKIKNPSLALEQLELHLEASESDSDGGRHKMVVFLNNEMHQQRQQDLIKQAFLGSFAAARMEFVQRRKALASRAASKDEEERLVEGQAMGRLAPVSRHDGCKQEASECRGMDSGLREPCGRKRKRVVVGSARGVDEVMEMPRKAVIPPGSFRGEVSAASSSPLIANARAVRAATGMLRLLAQQKAKADQAKGTDMAHFLGFKGASDLLCMLETNLHVGSEKNRNMLIDDAAAAAAAPLASRMCSLYIINIGVQIVHSSPAQMISFGQVIVSYFTC